MKIKEKKKNGKIKYTHAKREVASNTKPHKCQCEVGMQQPTRNEPVFRTIGDTEIMITNVPIYKCDICEQLEINDYVEKKLAILCEEAKNKGITKIKYN